MHKPLRRTPYQLRKKLEEKVKELLDLDMIKPVNGPTPWVNPVVYVPKREDIRLRLDMRRANEAVLRGRHPIPTVEEILQKMDRSTTSNESDLRMGYHQSELEPSSTVITTFATEVDLFRYKRLSFGVKVSGGAVSVCQCAIQTALKTFQMT